MYFMVRPTVPLLWCAFLLASGCQGNGSSPGTNPAGGGVVTEEQAGAASIRFLESSSTLLAQSIANDINAARNAASAAALAIACPEALLDTAVCEEGFVDLDFEACSLNQLGDANFFLSKLTGKFLSCASQGLEVNGDLSANAETELPAPCIFGSSVSPCQPTRLRLTDLKGPLNVTDEAGQAWVLTVLTGSSEIQWSTDGSGLFDAALIDGEVDLQAEGGAPRFRCLIHEGEFRCVPDADGDGVADADDNCPATANQDQQDVDGDGVGDACDDANIRCKVAPNCPETDCQDFRDACDIVDGRLKERGEDLFCVSGVCKVFFADIVSPDCSTDEPLPAPHQICYPGQECTGDIDCADYETCLEGCCRHADVIESYLSDLDQDGIRSLEDNCPEDVNPDQGDCDGDGRGDACDNCPEDSNPLQENREFGEIGGDPYKKVDGVVVSGGDACDPDDDNDGIPDVEDPCPLIFFGSIADNDGDGKSDICDNCGSLPNPDQANQDNDEKGDACDPCPDIPYEGGFFIVIDGEVVQIFECDLDWDTDGIENPVDNCPYNPNLDQADCDGNGYGDACDLPIDPDGDGLDQCSDDCWLFSSPDNSGCGGDEDSDTVDNTNDNCPYESNPLQEDIGETNPPCPVGQPCPVATPPDGVGDICDNCRTWYNPDQFDDDLDGVGNVCDNCFDVFNPDQADLNGNFQGDACEGGGGPIGPPKP